MDQIERSGTKLIGVVLNRLPSQGIGYYTTNRYYSSYYHVDQQKMDNSGALGWLRTKWAAVISRINPRARTASANKRVFKDIDTIDGEGDGYKWSD